MTNQLKCVYSYTISNLKSSEPATNNEINFTLEINKSKEILMKAINIIRGEAVLYEHFRKPEDILYELSEVCLL